MASSPIPQNSLEAVFTASTEAELTSPDPTHSRFPLGCHTIPRPPDWADALRCDVRADGFTHKEPSCALEPYRQRNSLRGTPGIADVLMTVFGKHPGRTTKMVLEAFSRRFAVAFFVRTASFGIHPVLAGALVGLLLSLPDGLGHPHRVDQQKFGVWKRKLRIVEAETLSRFQ